MWVRTRWLLRQQRGDTTQLTSGTQGHSEGKLREADNVHHGTLLPSFPASSSTTWPSPTSYSRNALDIRFLKSPGFSTWISSCPECLPVSHHYKKKLLLHPQNVHSSAVPSAEFSRTTPSPKENALSLILWQLPEQSPPHCAITVLKVGSAQWKQPSSITWKFHVEMLTVPLSS